MHIRSSLRSALAVGLVALLVSSVSAEAASPRGGTLSKSKRTLKWTGGPYTMSYPFSSVGPCLEGAEDANCDHFILKINMGQGARIEVTTRTAATGFEPLQSDATAPNDFDLFVYDPNGDEVGSDGNGSGNERVAFTHKAKFRNKPYEVRVVPFLLIPGATYQGMVRTLKFVK